MNNNFEFLDVITILGFVAQMQNLEKDEQYENYIKNFIYNLNEEIQKLHKENEEIIEKLDKVLNL